MPFWMRANDMRSLRFAEFGPPSVLRMEEVRIPEPGVGETLVQVKAAGINPSDVGNVAGRFKRTILPRIEYAAGGGDRDSLYYGLGVGSECSSNPARRNNSNCWRCGRGGTSSHTDCEQWRKLTRRSLRTRFSQEQLHVGGSSGRQLRRSG